MGSAHAQAPGLLLGTAGHVDHGKTSLVRALTGVDTDRLPEEKSRGITIELGFAHLPLPDGRVLGVVDVPGHEKFVRHMLMGASGVDFVLLVVAADEGVMPQTREHLDICRLLGARRGIVALTKMDRVDPELAELATLDVRQVLADTPLAGAPVVPVSALSGQGLPELRAAIVAAAAAIEGRAVDGPVRLPIDRVFTLKGLGTVVTGTLASGRLDSGEVLSVIPGAAIVTARSLQVHGQEQSAALAGQRVALNLAGTARGDLARGDVLVRAGEVAGSSVFDVELTWLAVAGRPLRRGDKLLCHALATQESAVAVPLDPGEIAAGASGFAQLHLGRPVALVPGDRFVLRGFRVLPGYGTTVGGGRVLRVLAPKRRRADPEAGLMLRRLAQAAPAERAALVIASAGALGLDRAAIGVRLGVRAEEAGRLATLATKPTLPTKATVATMATLPSKSAPLAGGVVALGQDAFVASQIVEALAADALAQVAAFHRAEPLSPGLSREVLRATLGRRPEGLADRVFAAVLERLQRDKRLIVEGEIVRAPSFSARPAEAAAEPTVEKLRTLFATAGLAPPWLDELPKLTGLSPAAARGALDVLLRKGEVVRVRSDLYFGRAAVDGLRERLRAYLVERGQITAQDWKAMTGQSRKYAIPLAEHFDADKLTLRVGEIRKLRGR